MPLEFKIGDAEVDDDQFSDDAKSDNKFDSKAKHNDDMHDDIDEEISEDITHRDQKKSGKKESKFEEFKIGDQDLSSNYEGFSDDNQVRQSDTFEKLDKIQQVKVKEQEKQIKKPEKKSINKKGRSIFTSKPIISVP